MKCIKEYSQQPQQSSFLEKENRILPSGNMSDGESWLLIELTPIRSDKIIRALHDYFVLNRPRSYCCDKHGVNSGYFGVCISRFKHVTQAVDALLNYYKMSKSETVEQVPCETIQYFRVMQ